MIEAKYKTVRYSGKERDATGLYYYGYRYYQPWSGRWLNPDPAGTIDGLNVYRFVRNNPINMEDAEGRVPIPKKAHYAWEGGNISATHLNNILRFKKMNPDYDVNVWTSRPMSIMSMLSHRSARDINVRNVNQLYEDFSHSYEQGVYFSGMFEREKGGPYRNYAAASDITRAVLMYMEGGIYMDVDVVTHQAFGELNAPNGFLICNPDLVIPGGGFSNAVLASSQYSGKAKTLIDTIKRNIKILESKSGQVMQALPHTQPLIEPNAVWTTKRSLNGSWEMPGYMQRLDATVFATGPAAIEGFKLCNYDDAEKNQQNSFSQQFFRRNSVNMEFNVPLSNMRQGAISRLGLDEGFDGRGGWSCDFKPGRRASIG